MDVQYQRCSYDIAATFLVFKVWGSARARAAQVAYEQSRDKQSFLDRWVTKFAKVWGSAIRGS